MGLKNIYRVTHYKDQVPRLPRPTDILSNKDGLWRHFGHEYYITQNDFPQTAGEISVFADEEDSDGNSGPNGERESNQRAYLLAQHREYFIKVSGNPGC
jgi:hypothetical protein